LQLTADVQPSRFPLVSDEFSPCFSPAVPSFHGSPGIVVFTLIEGKNEQGLNRLLLRQQRMD
jgi:hypothetical protein